MLIQNMPRPPQPWYWKARKSWFVTISGIRHNLGPDKVDAEDRFHQLMLARRETAVQEGSLAEMLNRFYL